MKMIKRLFVLLVLSTIFTGCCALSREELQDVNFGGLDDCKSIFARYIYVFAEDLDEAVGKEFSSEEYSARDKLRHVVEFIVNTGSFTESEVVDWAIHYYKSTISKDPAICSLFFNDLYKQLADDFQQKLYYEESGAY